MLCGCGRRAEPAERKIDVVVVEGKRIRRGQERPIHVFQQDARLGQQPLRQGEWPPRPCRRRQIAIDVAQSIAAVPGNASNTPNAAQIFRSSLPSRRANPNRSHSRMKAYTGISAADSLTSTPSPVAKTMATHGKIAPRPVASMRSRADTYAHNPASTNTGCRDFFHALHDVTDSGEIDRCQQPSCGYTQCQQLRIILVGLGLPDLVRRDTDNAAKQCEEQKSVEQMNAQVHQLHVENVARAPAPIECKAEHGPAGAAGNPRAN